MGFFLIVVKSVCNMFFTSGYMFASVKINETWNTIIKAAMAAVTRQRRW